MNSRLTVEILPTHTPALFDVAVDRAAQWLAAGELVALPTETVYGLAANALNARAVERIYEVKGRPAHNPIIVHVASLEMARRCVRAWPESAERLSHAFWPGPLTLVLPRAIEVPDIVTAGGDTVGVRWPSHPLIQAVIRRCGFPLAAPSANLSNRLSPTSASHVREGLGDTIRLIVDGGQSQVGIESTVIDLTTDPPSVLRPGMIHADSLEAVLGGTGSALRGNHAEKTDESSVRTLRSPGLLGSHYSPRARLVVLEWQDDASLKSQLCALGMAPADCWVLAHERIPAASGWGGISVIPQDPEAYARALYGELHRCDAEGAPCILVEALPDRTEWQGIRDRLRRATRGGAVT